MTQRDIVELIDGACLDWETSNDAMRWTPDPPVRSGSSIGRSIAESMAGSITVTSAQWGDRRIAAGDRVSECLFVGGPAHGIRRMVVHDGDRLPLTYSVVIARPIRVDSVESLCADYLPCMDTVIYYLGWEMAFSLPVYCAPGASRQDVRDALRLAGNQ